jgi:hypothetical protein
MIHTHLFLLLCLIVSQSKWRGKIWIGSIKKMFLKLWLINWQKPCDPINCYTILLFLHCLLPWIYTKQWKPFQDFVWMDSNILELTKVLWEIIQYMTWWILMSTNRLALMPNKKKRPYYKFIVVRPPLFSLILQHL